MTAADLELAPVALTDVDALYALNSDPRVWAHFPSGVHTEPAQTERQVRHFVELWERDGLGYWTARTPAGDLVGIGGCSDIRGAGWNLYYRIAPAHQGHGHATAVARAALAAAAATDPGRPVYASLLAHNRGSAAVAVRVGLVERWRGPALGNPVPGAVRVIYADRELAPETVAALVRPAPG